MIAQTRDGDVEFVARAAERGISAWIESITPEVVQGAIEVALRRYEETDAAAGQGRPARVGARAPGGDRARQGHPDGAPRHRRARRRSSCMRDHARAQSRRVVDVALAVTEGHALLPKGG